MNEGLEGGMEVGGRYRGRREVRGGREVQGGRKEVRGWEEGGTEWGGGRYKRGGVWSICIVYIQEVF